MPKIKHPTLKNAKTSTSHGIIHLNNEGIAEVSQEAADHLTKCGFRLHDVEVKTAPELPSLKEAPAAPSEPPKAETPANPAPTSADAQSGSQEPSEAASNEATAKAMLSEGMEVGDLIEIAGEVKRIKELDAFHVVLENAPSPAHAAPKAAKKPKGKAKKGK